MIYDYEDNGDNDVYSNKEDAHNSNDVNGMLKTTTTMNYLDRRVCFIFYNHDAMKTLPR